MTKKEYAIIKNVLKEQLSIIKKELVRKEKSIFNLINYRIEQIKKN
jgi:hypothetical protein